MAEPTYKRITRLAPPHCSILRFFVARRPSHVMPAKAGIHDFLSTFRIIVPAGTKGAAYVHPFPDVQHEEFEILLNIGTKLRILRNDETQLVLLAGEDEGHG
jgi:hypothetical protein